MDATRRLMLRPPCAACLRLQGPFTPAWAENIFVASSLKRYSKRRTDGKATPVAERFLKQNEFVEAVVRVSYAKHPDLVRYAKPPLFHRAAAAGREACAQANSSQTQMQPPPACLPLLISADYLTQPLFLSVCLCSRTSPTRSSGAWTRSSCPSLSTRAPKSPTGSSRSARRRR
jgi:hypothetical protein